MFVDEVADEANDITLQPVHRVALVGAALLRELAGRTEGVLALLPDHRHRVQQICHRKGGHPVYNTQQEETITRHVEIKRDCRFRHFPSAVGWNLLVETLRSSVSFCNCSRYCDDNVAEMRDHNMFTTA